MRKRILSLLMAVAMCLSLMPEPVWAVGDDVSDASGQATKMSPDEEMTETVSDAGTDEAKSVIQGKGNTILYGGLEYRIENGQIYCNGSVFDFEEGTPHKIALADNTVYAIVGEKEQWIVLDNSLAGEVSLLGNSDNEREIFRFAQTTLGVNTAAACGILANIYAESSFSPTAYVIDTNGLPSYGICQWNGGRYTALQNYCSQNDYDYTTLSGQLQYLKYELTGSESYAFGKVKNVPDTAQGAYDAGYNWARYFERCASQYYMGRAERARDVYWLEYSTATLSAAFVPCWPLQLGAGNSHINALDHYSGGSDHRGMDIVARGTDTWGQNVVAVADGVVDTVSNTCPHDKASDSACNCGSTWGNYILIRHNYAGTTYYSRYAHLRQNSITVSNGDSVSAGQVIAQCGNSGNSTGPHLHLELYEGSRTQAKAQQTFQYYRDNPSQILGVCFSTHIVNSSTYFGRWVQDNCVLQNGCYYYLVGNLSISGETYLSGRLEPGQGFGLRGIISSSHTITNVHAWVYETDAAHTTHKRTAMEYETNPNSNSYDIRTSGLNDAFVFNNLTVGYYCYVVEASDSSPITKTLIHSCFQVGDPTPAPSTLHIEDAVHPTGRLEPGRGFGLRGIIRSNYTLTDVSAWVRDASGTVVNGMEYHTNPNSNSYDIQTGGLNDAFIFNNLPVGHYHYVVQASDSSSLTLTLIDSDFHVGDPPVSLIITYNADGGGGAPAQQTATSGQDIVLSAEKPYRSGYRFAGWAISSGGVAQYQPGGVYTGNADVTLYAVWIEIPNSLTLGDIDGDGKIDKNDIDMLSLAIAESIILTDAQKYAADVNADGKIDVFDLTRLSNYLGGGISRLAVLISIEIASKPSKTIYELGEAWDGTGLTIKANYSDNTSETLTNGFSIEGFDSVAPGTKTITVAYEGKPATFTVVVQEQNASQIVIADQTVAPNATFDVPIQFKNNPGVSSFELLIDYDADALELIDKAEGDFSGVIFGQNLSEKPYPMAWTGGTQDNQGSVAGTLTFRVKNSAVETTVISVAYGEEPPYNTSEQAVSFELVNGTISVRSFLPGDANGDGKVTARDATRILQYVAKWDVKIVNAAADVNGDSKITARDATRILQYVAKWDVTLQGESASLQSLSESPVANANVLAADGRRIVIENQTVAPDAEFDVPVRFEGNPGISSFELLIDYDADALELIDKAEGDFLGVVFGQTLTEKPYPMAWTGGTQDNNGSVAGILKFRAKKNFSGATQIRVSYGAESPYNVADEEVSFELVNGTIHVGSSVATAIEDVQRDGNNAITANIVCADLSATVFCAVYNNAGKMLAVESRNVTDTNRYDFQFGNTSFDYAQVFILDDNFAPLCASGRVP